MMNDISKVVILFFKRIIIASFLHTTTLNLADVATTMFRSILYSFPIDKEINESFFFIVIITGVQTRQKCGSTEGCSKYIGQNTSEMKTT